GRYGHLLSLDALVRGVKAPCGDLMDVRVKSMQRRLELRPSRGLQHERHRWRTPIKPDARMDADLMSGHGGSPPPYGRPLATAVAGQLDVQQGVPRGAVSQRLAPGRVGPEIFRSLRAHLRSSSRRASHETAAWRARRRALTSPAGSMPTRRL